MKRHLFKKLLCVMAAGLVATQAKAASGSDNSANYTSWTSGSTAGTGFGSWAFHSDNHGDGFTGLEKTTAGQNIQAADSSVWKLYAIGFNGAPTGDQAWEEATAYRAFLSPLKEAGDGFALSFEMQNGNGGVGNPGQMGFALRNGNTTGSGNRNAGARLQVYLDGSTNYVIVEDSLGQRVTTVTNDGPGAAYDCAVTLTGTDTYSLSITRYSGIGVTDAPVVVTGTLAGSGDINSFAMFNWNFSAGIGVNSDAFFNKVSYTNQSPAVCPPITLRSLQNLAQGVATSQNVVANGGSAPYSYSVSSGSLPAGLSLSGAGVLSGTPTTLGTSTFTVTATDFYGCMGSRTYALGVYATGADNSLNYASGTWTNGANAGTGFTSWNFNSDTHGGNNSYAGLEWTSAGDVNLQDGGGNLWKLYAIGFGSTAWEEATAYRQFNVPLSQSGDGCSVSFGLQNGNGGVGNPGQAGFALRNGDATGASARNFRARLQVYLDGSTNYVIVEDSLGQRVTTVTNDGPGAAYDCTVTLTGPDTYSLSIARYAGLGSNAAPVIVTGTLASSGPIDSLAMFNWNYDATSGKNSDAYFNNLAYTGTAPLITNNVTFQVDMTAQIFAGNFDPSTDNTVEVWGSFNQWSSGALLTNNPSLPSSASNIYSGVVSIVGAVGSGETYKFTHDSVNTVFESSTPKTSTLDTGFADYNRFFQLPNTNSTVLPVVFFDDKSLGDFLPVDMMVTFSVDMNGAVTTSGSNFVAGSDTVWINGEFIPWYPWYDPVNPDFGPAQYQLTAMGGGIYSVSVTIPKGKPVAFEYKYGVGISATGDLGPRDNEAAVGENHFRVIRTTATGTYTMPQDTFGNQYHEPLFSGANKADGQLTIGAPSGGTIPVRWLGRPGAHLQSASNVTGPWTNHFNTDGTNWSSGTSTTNGLMSVTNWPVVGNTFLRLANP